MKNQNSIIRQSFVKILKAERAKLTKHGRSRMLERSISWSDIFHSVESGYIVNSNFTAYPYPEIIVQGKTKAGVRLSTFWGYDYAGFRIILISVYFSDSNIWFKGHIRLK